MKTLHALLKTMRPHQWTKNVVVFAALVFDGKFLQPEPLVRTVIAFVLFCLVSSAVYLLNDLADIEKDRAHPTKQNRPLAAGTLKPWIAVAAIIVILALSWPLAYVLDPLLGLILAGYFLLNVAYSFSLKNLVILDALSVAAGFVLRVGAGSVVVGVERFSPWLYVCVTMIALLIALGKRRAELVELQGGAINHRAILDEYTVPFLDQLIGIVTGATIVSYSIYTFSAENLPDNHFMMLTIAFVVYFLFRYLYLIHVKGEGGAPDELLFKDKPLFVTAVLWGLFAVGVLYLSNHR